MSQWKVGVDIGGTFTDVVAIHSSGAVRDGKTLTVPRDPLAGLQNALKTVALEWSQVSDLMHGTTMVTNSLVEGKLARVALITTQGFEDVLQVARASRRHLYNLDAAPRPTPDVPRALCCGVAERITHTGEVLQPLDDAEIARIVAWVQAADVQAVAVCLLHAYINPAHEARLGEALRKICSFVSTSHEVSPEAREYERTVSTVLNAAVMPSASAYLDKLSAAVPSTTNVGLFHSAGGMAAPETLRTHPLTLALSGPAAGAAATAAVCRTLGIRYGLGFDMGGTTTDVCLVSDGAAEVSNSRSLGGRPIRQPMVAVESVGAGGGSIVKIVGSLLSIGPESAGSDPGPVSYGRGGTRPTIADVNVLLGYIDPERALGGEIRVDPALADAAMQPMAAQLGESTRGFALGVLRVANSTMARAMRKVTIEKGIDVRETTLIAFGGAGPIHAVSLARDVGVDKVIVPAFSSGFSAYGCVTAPTSVMRQKTVRLGNGDGDLLRLGQAREALLADGAASLAKAQVLPEGTRIAETALIRYVGQSVAVEVGYSWPVSMHELGRLFRETHERQYGYATDEPFLIESLRIEMIARQAPGPAALATSTGTNVPVPLKVSDCVFGPEGAVATPRHDRKTLPIDIAIAGPCIVEDAWSTVVIPPGCSVSADAHGHLHIEV